MSPVIPNRDNIITDGKMSYLPTDMSTIITYGQSLSVGVGTTDILTTTPLTDTFMLDNDVRDRGYAYPWPFEPLVATEYGTSGGECVAVAMANVFKTLVNNDFTEFANNVEFLSISAGASGTSIEQLSKEYTGSQQFYMNRFYNWALAGSKGRAYELNKSISCPAIIYMQGEYNYSAIAGKGMDGISANTTDKQQYKEYLAILKNNMQNDIMTVYRQSFKPLFLIYQTSGVYVTEGMGITMAQIEFAQENDDVILLNPHYQLPDFSGGHLTANGYRWDGELQAKSLYKIFVEGLNEYALKYNNITIESDIITIDLDVPVEPVVFDTYTTPLQTSYGFRVTQNGIEINISSVEIVNGNQIKLNMPSILSGEITIAYAGYGRNGSGNVRDSDPWVSQYNYADETNLDQPTYTPLDINSENLYGKKYPCQNWLQQFFYKTNI